MKTWLVESKKDLGMVAGLILLSALYRLLPHPFNFAPVAAMAIFGGACFANRGLAVAAPLLAMLLSDAVIGFHSQWISVYFSFALIAFASSVFNRKISLARILGTSLGSSLFFFFATNFEVWARSGFYPQSFAGLMQSYVMGLPFLQATMAGDLVFSLALFGIYALSTKRVLKVVAH